MIEARALNQALKLAGNIILARPTTPHIGCFYLEFQRDRLIVTTTDKAGWIQVSLPGKFNVKKPVAVFAPKMLSSLIDKIDGPINLKVTDLQLEITFNNSSYKIDCLDSQEQSWDMALPEMSDAQPLESPKDMGEIIKGLLPVVKRTNLQEGIRGILFDTVFVATDGHRMVTRKNIWLKSKKALRGEHVQYLPELLCKWDVNVFKGAMSPCGKYAGFYCDCGDGVSATFIVGIQQEPFANYQHIMPKQKHRKEMTTVECDRQVLINAIERVKLIDTNKMHLVVDDGKFLMSAGCDHRVRIVVPGVKGTVLFAIGIKPDYLLEALNRSDTDTARILFGDSPLSPILVEKDTKNTELIMPIQMRKV